MQHCYQAWWDSYCGRRGRKSCVPMVAVRTLPSPYRHPHHLPHPQRLMPTIWLLTASMSISLPVGFLYKWPLSSVALNQLMGADIWINTPAPSPGARTALRHVLYTGPQSSTAEWNSRVLQMEIMLLVLASFLPGLTCPLLSSSVSWDCFTSKPFWEFPASGLASWRT